MTLGPDRFPGHGGKNVEMEGQTFLIPSILPYPDFSLKNVRGKLNLSENQKKQVQEILGNSRNLYERLVSELRQFPPQERNKVAEKAGVSYGGTPSCHHLYLF